MCEYVNLKQLIKLTRDKELLSSGEKKQVTN